MKIRAFLSKKLISAVREHDEPVYMIAVKNQINPSTLSNLLNRVLTVEKDDKRIVRLGGYLKLNAADCFEEINTGAYSAK